MRRSLLCLWVVAGCGIGSNGLELRRPVAQVRVSPAASSLRQGDTIRLVAVTLDAAGNPATPVNRLQWFTPDQSHISVDTTGLVRGLLAGPAQVRVTADSVTGTAAVTVIALPAASVEIIAPSGPIEAGDTARFVAIVRDVAGMRLVGAPIRWTTSDTLRARIDSTGLLGARSIGNVQVTASVDSVSGTVGISVLVPVATVTVTPDSLALQYDDTSRLTVTLRDSTGGVITDRPIAVRVFGDSQAITLSAGFGVSSVDAGRAIVTASAGHASGTAIVDVASLALTSISLGARHTCGLESDGTAFCWGDGSSGALGRGDTLSATRPRRVSGGLLFSHVSAGDGSTCGLTLQGAAYCWGWNASRQAGTGGGSACVLRSEFIVITGNCVLSPSPVPGGLSFTLIVAGQSSACALTAAGAAYCWGAGGILGDSTTDTSTAPVAVIGGHQFTAIGKPDAGGTCALDVAGAIFCWGRAPLPLASGTGYTTLTGAGGAYCGLKGNDAYCWGSIPSDFGSSSTSPTWILPGRVFTAVAATGDHICGVTTAGAAACWGRNGYGELGDGTLISRFDSAGTTVAGGLQFTQIAVGGWTFGEAHSCGVATNARVYCWGANIQGQVGRFVASRALLPVAPAGQH